jgi:CheY-specific phosphatase CheX
MKNIFKEAVKNYIDSIEGELNDCKVKPHRGFMSKIDIKGDKNYSVYVVVPKEKLDYIAELWFGDSSEYDIEDLTKEIANLIVGNAKIVAQDKGVSFEISTPEFVGEYDTFEYDDILKFKFKNRCFYVIFKEK